VAGTRGDNFVSERLADGACLPQVCHVIVGLFCSLVGLFCLYSRSLLTLSKVSFDTCADLSSDLLTGHAVAGSMRLVPKLHDKSRFKVLVFLLYTYVYIYIILCIYVYIYTHTYILRYIFYIYI
jgi:hypothetical protein